MTNNRARPACPTGTLGPGIVISVEEPAVSTAAGDIRPASPEEGLERMATSSTESSSNGGTDLAVGSPVTAFAGTDREVTGRIADDFGEFTPVATEYDGERIAGPAKRWAVLTDAGDLVFADSDDLAILPE